MDRTPINSRRRVKQVDDKRGTSAAGPARKIDRLAEVVDLCTEARRIAETMDEKLLSYLLAMAIQETRAGMRQEVSAAAGVVKAPSRRTTGPRR